MLSKYYKSFVQLFFVGLSSYLLHKIVFYACNISTKDFYYSLEQVYLVFFEMAAIVYLILIFIKDSYYERIGIVFLYLSFAQMLLAYLVVRPVLAILSETQWVEKCSFFGAFVLFLSFETRLTIRLLNEKG